MRGCLKWGGTLASVLVLMSGCGGSSSPDPTAKFKSGYEPVANQLRQISHSIGIAITHAPSQTDAQLTVTFRDLATRWQSQLSQLETLKPPSKLATVFNTMTAASTRVETDLNAVVAAAETHSKSAATQAGASIVTDILSAKSASTTITNTLGLK